MAASGVAHVIKEIVKTDWHQYRARAGARCLVAMAIVLVTAIAAGDPADGIVAAIGTLMVGFGSTKSLRGSNILPMILTVVGISISAAAGTLLGRDHLVTTMIAGFGGLIYGLLLVLNDTAAWVVLQCVIAFLVATSFPAYGIHALRRGELLFAGGLLQIVFTLLIWRFKNKREADREWTPVHPRHLIGGFSGTVLPFLRSRLDFSHTEFRYALRLSLTMMIGVITSRLLNQQNSYWLPMTT